MSSKKNTTPISLQPLDELFGTTGDGANGICEVSVLFKENGLSGHCV